MHLPFETPPETFQIGCSDWPKVQMSEAGNQNASSTGRLGLVAQGISRSPLYKLY